MDGDARRKAKLSVPARLFLGVAGLGLAVLVLIGAQEPAEFALLGMLSLLCFVGSATGLDLAALVSGPSQRTSLVLPAEETGSSRPFLGAATGTVLGWLYFLAEGSTVYVVAGFCIGLFLGTTRPLFRHRIVAGLLIWIAGFAGMVGTGLHHDFGLAGTAFLSWTFAFAYAALFWGPAMPD